MSYQFLIWLYRYLWIAPHVLLLAVAALMFRKKLHKQYPIFFTYLLFEFIEFCAVFAMVQRVPLSLYVKVDLLGRIGDAVLLFGIIQELFSAALARLDSIRNQVVGALRWVTVALVLMASIYIWAICYNSVHPAAFRGYWSIEALKGAQCGLLFLVFLWHRFLGVKMRSLSFGVALGMGLVAAIDLLALAFKTFMVVHNGMALDILNMAAYHAAVIIWLYFALVRESVAFASPASLARLRQHAVELGRLSR
jgi:hypothetical protein